MKGLIKIFVKILIGTALASQVLVITALAKPDWPVNAGIQAGSGIVVDFDSGAVLFGQGIHQSFAPASITKLLTALVVIENSNLNDMVTFSHDAVYDVESGSGNKLNSAQGDQMTVRDCLYALLLRSSNQAANALAEHVAGSRDAFAQLMNKKVAQLGCQECHFVNPSGLNDQDHVITAYDMSIIARAAFSNPTLLQIASTLRYKLGPTQNYPQGMTITMENKLLTDKNPNSQFYCPEAVAGKTGYTSLAGNTLVLLGEKDGRKVVTVVLKGTQPQYYMDAKALQKFGLEGFKNWNIKENENAYVTGSQPVDIGGKTYAPADLEIDPGGVITLPEAAAFADAKKSLVATLPVGHPDNGVGLIQYSYDGRAIGQAYLCLKKTPVPQIASTKPAVAPAQPKGKGGGFSSPALWALILVLLAGAAGAAYVVYRKQEEAKEQQRRRERRRKRLQEVGCSEEEFKQLVEQRKQIGRRQPPSRLAPGLPPSDLPTPSSPAPSQAEEGEANGGAD